MPQSKLPKNVIRRGNSFYFRMMVRGKLVRKSLETSDLKVAEQKATELRARFEAQSGGPDTLACFSERWLSEWVKQRRTPTNHKIAVSSMERHVLPILGSKLLVEVAPADFRTLRADLENKGLSPRSVRHVLSDLRCLFRYAVETETLNVSPFKSSVMPRIKEEAPKRLTDEQVDGILDACPDKYRLMVLTALGTGIRWGELHSLQWKHVKDLPKPHLVLEGTKSGKVRRVPLEKGLWEALRDSQGDGEYVFPFRSAHVKGVIQRAIERKLGWHFHWHQFRHTFACRYLEAGGSLAALQLILGHSSSQMTERYARLSDQAVFNEADLVLTQVACK